MKKIGLCLGGGGARGLCHIEFLKVFDELEIKPSIICGSSMGAIIGALYAEGRKAVDIQELVDNLNFRDLLKMFDLSILNKASLIKGKGVENYLRKHLSVKTFEDLQIPTKIVATDFWRRKQVILDKGDLVSAIRASIAIPALFEPYIIEDRVLIDGGISNNLPYNIIEKECELIVAVDVTGSRTVPLEPEIPSWFKTVMDSIDIMQSSILDFQMKLRKPDIYLKPKLKDFDILDFEKADEIRESVKDEVEKFREELQNRMKQKKLFF